MIDEARVGSIVNLTWRPKDFWQEESNWKDKELRILNKRLLETAAELKRRGNKSMELEDIKAEMRKLEESKHQIFEKTEALKGLLAERESYKRAKAEMYNLEKMLENDN